MITVDEFYTRARWVPLLVPASCLLIVSVAALITGGTMGELSRLLLFPVWASICYVVPYGVFLIVVPRYLTPKSEREWRRIELLTPLCIAAVFAMAVGLYVGRSDWSKLGWALMGSSAIALGFGYPYVAFIEIGLAI